MTEQRRHEAPAIGQMMVRMMRALVTRAAEGDWEALEALAELEALAPQATSMGLQLAHDRAGYSWGELAPVVGSSRQAVQQRAARLQLDDNAGTVYAAGHVLVPGHDKRTCAGCKAVA